MAPFSDALHATEYCCATLVNIKLLATVLAYDDLVATLPMETVLSGASATP
jgi:hypothetical protein